MLPKTIAFVVVLSSLGAATPTPIDSPKVHLTGEFPDDSDVTPDLDWIPARSDEGYTYGGAPGLDVYGGIDLFSYESMMKSVRSGDARGIKNLGNSGRVAIIAPGTKVFVIERIINPLIDEGRHVLVVRIMDGKYRGEKVWLPEECVERLIPRPVDLAYRPNKGDVAFVMEDRSPAAKTWAALDQYANVAKSGLIPGSDALSKVDDVFLLPRLTKIEVIEVYGPKRERSAIPTRDIATNLEEAGKYAAEHPAGYASEIKILDGPHARERVFVSRRNIGRFVGSRQFTAPVATGKGGKGSSKAITTKAIPPEIQAANALQLGKNLRFEGNRGAAVEYFRKAIKLAPDSGSGKEAAKLLQGMREK